MVETEHESFGDYLRIRMQEARITPMELAYHIWMTQTSILRWMYEDPPPSPSNCEQLAEALSLSLDEVLAKAGHPLRP